MSTCTQNSIDDDGNGYVDDFYGWNFFNDSNVVVDTVAEGYHGTHVAGTIGAVGNNALGVVGMNWRVNLVALKILPPISGGSTYASRVIAALDYCVQKNIKVSNNSYVGGTLSVNECAAIHSAGDQIGHIFVAAAGNDGADLDVTPKYPASCARSQSGCTVCPVTNIITVTATNEDDFRGCMKWVTPLSDPPVCFRRANYGL